MLQNTGMKGIFYKMICLIFSACLTLAFSYRSPTIGIVEQIFVTSISATFILYVLIFIFGVGKNTITAGKNSLNEYYNVHKWYIVRSIFSILAMTTWSYTAKVLGANEATLLSYLIPIMTIIISSLVRLEKLTKTSVLGMIICFAAVFLSADASSGEYKASFYNLLIGIFTSFCWSAYDVVCKKQSATEHYAVQGFFVFLYSSILMLPFVMNGILNTPINDIIFGVLLSLFRVGIVLTVFLSYKYLSVGSLMVMSYLRLPIMLFITMTFFDITPSSKIILAAIIIFSVNFLVLLINKKRKKVLNSSDNI